MRRINKKKIICLSIIIIILVILITKNIINNNKIKKEQYSLGIANSNSNLVASQIKKGITIGGITGTLEILNTSDATATAEDIALGKTAYVDGKKITGTMDDRRSVDILKAGDYVKYDSGPNGIIICRVLYDINSEYGIQLISDKTVKNVEIGIYNQDEEMREEYNSIISKLNQYAYDYYNSEYALDTRCVGSNPKDKNNETQSTVYFPEEMSKFSGDTYFKDKDDNYLEDYNAMKENYLLEAGSEYFLASRNNQVINAENVSQSFYLDVRGINTIGKLINYSPYFYYQNFEKHSLYDNVCESGLRICIKLKTNLKISNGDGKTAETAYELSI